MCHAYIRMHPGMLFKIGVIKSPVMGQVCTYEDDITRFEPFDTIADELRSFPLLEMDQFHFRGMSI